MPEFENIALTTDFSENADAAFPYAVELARRYGATLHLIHVLDQTPYYAAVPMPEAWSTPHVSGWLHSMREEDDRRLRMRAEQLAGQEKIKVLPVFRQGNVVQELLAFLVEKKPDLLVIATHGRTGLAHLFMGSIAERMVRWSPCPVLSVRPPSIPNRSFKN